MAMTNIQTSQLRYNESLISRVAVEIAKAAQFVLAQDPPPDPAVITSARRALLDPVNETRAFMWYVVVDPTVQNNGSDPNATTDPQLATIVATHYPAIWGAQV